MRVVYEDDDHDVEVDTDRSVWLRLFGEGLSAHRRYTPEEALTIGYALVGAGAEAGSQCCVDGVTVPRRNSAMTEPHGFRVLSDSTDGHCTSNCELRSGTTDLAM